MKGIQSEGVVVSLKVLFGRSSAGNGVERTKFKIRSPVLQLKIQSDAS